MKKIKIAYYISTGLITALMLMSAGMYFFNHDEVSELFTSFGYPTYIIYPLAIAKLLGLFAIWNPNFKSLKEWAYAGFFFDLVLAAGAHLGIQDGGHYTAIIVIIILFISYFSNKKLTE